MSEGVDEEETGLRGNVGLGQGHGTCSSGIWILTPCSFTIILLAFDNFNLEKTTLEKYSKERKRWSHEMGPGPRCRRLTAPQLPTAEGRDLPAAQRTRRSRPLLVRAPPPLTVCQRVRLLCWLDGCGGGVAGGLAGNDEGGGVERRPWLEASDSSPRTSASPAVKQTR